MKLIRNIALGLILTTSAAALADTSSTSTVASDWTTSTKLVKDGDILSFAVPKVGFRIGGGNWNEFMVDGGIDVTLKVPIIPLPAIRVDGEVWGKPGSFGQDRKGNCVSILGVQTFIAGYAGIGPAFYYTDDQGDHKSGFGAKALVGMSLPHNTYAEAGIILGPTTPPIFFTFGQRF